MQTGIGDTFRGNSSPVSNDGSLSWHWRQREGRKQGGKPVGRDCGGGSRGRDLHMPSWGGNSHMFLLNTCTVQKPPRVPGFTFSVCEWRDKFHKINHISMKTTFQEKVLIFHLQLGK